MATSVSANQDIKVNIVPILMNARQIRLTVESVHSVRTQRELLLVNADQGFMGMDLFVSKANAIKRSVPVTKHVCHRLNLIVSARKDFDLIKPTHALI